MPAGYPKPGKYDRLLFAAMDNGLDATPKSDDEILMLMGDELGRKLGKTEKRLALDAYHRVLEAHDSGALDYHAGSEEDAPFLQHDAGRIIQHAFEGIRRDVLKEHGLLSPGKLPADLKPAPSVFGKRGADVVNQWLQEGGGKAAGKGHPIVPSTDPTSETVLAQAGVHPGTHDPVFRQAGETAGQPDLNPDTSHLNAPDVGHLIHPGGGIEDTSGQLAGTQSFTEEQIAQLLEDIYGSKGAIRNYTDGGKRKKGPMITTLRPDMGRTKRNQGKAPGPDGRTEDRIGWLIDHGVHSPGEIAIDLGQQDEEAFGEKPHPDIIGDYHGIAEELLRKRGLWSSVVPLGMPGAKINVPGAAMPTGPLINVPGAAMPTGPLINIPRIDKAKLLAAMARNQAKASGHHLIA